MNSKRNLKSNFAAYFLKSVKNTRNKYLGKRFRILDHEIYTGDCIEKVYNEDNVSLTGNRLEIGEINDINLLLDQIQDIKLLI